MAEHRVTDCPGSNTLATILPTGAEAFQSAILAGGSVYKPSFVSGRLSALAIFVSVCIGGAIGLSRVFGYEDIALQALVWPYLVSALVAQIWFGVALYTAAKNLEFFRGDKWQPALTAIVYIAPFVIIIAYAIWIGLTPHLSKEILRTTYLYFHYVFVAAVAVAWLVTPFFVHRVHKASVNLTEEAWLGKSVATVGMYYFLLFISKFMAPKYAEQHGVNAAFLSASYEAIANLMLIKIINDIVTGQELAAQKIGVGVLDLRSMRTADKITTTIAWLAWWWVVIGLMAGTFIYVAAQIIGFFIR